jgi:hypothetical protein
MNRSNLVVLVVLTLALLGGCATTPPDATGFLGEGWQLQPDKYGKAGLLWAEKPGFDWQRYRRVQLDPVLVYYHPRAGSRAIQPDELQKLAEYFREAVVTELAGSYPVTKESGPDVLRVRAAITDVVPANPALNVATTLVAFVPLDLGGAAIEAEFIDSVSGERLAAMVERKRGSPVDLKGGFTELGHARTAFREWSVDLKHALKTHP